MKLKIAQLVAGGALVGFLGMAGTQLASAQEDTTSTTEVPAVTEETTPEDTTTEDTTTQDSTTEDGKNCDKDGDGVPDAEETETEAS